jgi:hypothetical protein
MNENLVYFNGINGATGRYLMPPVALEAVAGAARREPPRSPEETALLKRVRDQLRRPFLALPFDVDATRVAEAGWAVVFAQDTPADVRAALQPLIDHRNQRIPPDRRKVLEYRKGETMRDWLLRNQASPGSINPSRVPYYLLLVGDPAAIPFEFQYLLDIEYAVGRLSFESAREYEQYARSVVDYENANAVPNARAVDYWATRHNDVDATQMSADWLATPLYQGVPAAGDQPAQRSVADVLAYQARLFKGKDATKASLAELLHPAKDKAGPALLFTASHGLGWPRTDAAQKDAQGALLCQGFPVGDPLAGLPQPGDYLGRLDVTDDARVHGLIAFLFACFGAGTPEFNNYLYEGDQNFNFLFDRSQRPERLADRPFLAPLPRRLLAHPQGAALAVIGHVERAWGYSIRPLGADFRPVDSVGPQLAPFRNCLGRILKGEPVGHATKDISDKYAILAADLLTQLDKGAGATLPPDAALAWAWVERNDARNYVLLGDPAVQLRVDKLAKPAAGPPAFAVAAAPAAAVAAAPAGTAATGVAFDVPKGYVDLTNYAFNDPVTRRRLTVVPAAGLTGDDDLRQAAAAYRARAEDLCAARDVTVSDVQPRADGAMITLAFTFTEGPAGAGGTYRERTAFVRFAGGGGVQLSYVAPEGDAGAEGEFRRLLASARPAGPGPAPAPAVFHVPAAATTPGLVPCRVGPVRLDVDAALRGPSAYRLASNDGAVRLELTVQPPSGAPAFAAPAAAAAPGGLFARVAQAPGDVGGPVRFEVAPDPWAAPPQAGPPTFALAAAAAPAPEDSREVAGVRLRLVARSAPQDAERGRKALDEVKNSLRPAE